MIFLDNKGLSSTPCKNFHVYPYEFKESYKISMDKNNQSYMTIEKCTSCGEYHHKFLKKPEFPRS